MDGGRLEKSCQLPGGECAAGQAQCAQQDHIWAIHINKIGEGNKRKECAAQWLTPFFALELWSDKACQRESPKGSPSCAFARNFPIRNYSRPSITQRQLLKREEHTEKSRAQSQMLGKTRVLAIDQFAGDQKKHLPHYLTAPQKVPHAYRNKMSNGGVACANFNKTKITRDCAWRLVIKIGDVFESTCAYSSLTRHFLIRSNSIEKTTGLSQHLIFSLPTVSPKNTQFGRRPWVRPKLKKQATIWPEAVQLNKTVDTG